MAAVCGSNLPSLPFLFHSFLLLFSFFPFRKLFCTPPFVLFLYLPSLFIDLLFIEKLKVQADDKFLSLASFPLFSQLPSFFLSLLTSFSLPLFSLGIFSCVVWRLARVSVKCLSRSAGHCGTGERQNHRLLDEWLCSCFQ